MDRGDPGSTKCSEALISLGTEAMALLEPFSSLWQLAFKEPLWLVLLWHSKSLSGWSFSGIQRASLAGPSLLLPSKAPLWLEYFSIVQHSQALRGPPSLGFFSIGQLLALVCGVREATVTAPPPACGSAVLPCLHDCPTFLQRHSPLRSPPSIPSGCLLTVNS